MQIAYEVQEEMPMIAVIRSNSRKLRSIFQLFICPLFFAIALVFIPLMFFVSAPINSAFKMVLARLIEGLYVGALLVIFSKLLIKRSSRV